MRSDTFDVLRAVLGAVGMVYMITHVEDDVGEATVRGALEAVGLVGSRPGQIPPHRCEPRVCRFFDRLPLKGIDWSVM